MIAPDAPAGHRDTRRHNLSLVLREVFERGRVSRARLAEVTGLTRPTVSSLVTELLDASLVVEGETGRDGKVGRPGRPLSVDGDSVAGVGIEINVDYISCCVLDLLGRVRHRRVARHDNRTRSPESVVGAATRIGTQALDRVGKQGMVAGGVTVAVPGPVDSAAGTLLGAPNLGWDNLPLAEMIGGQLDGGRLPVRIENEANLAALGELWEGQGREWGDFLQVSGQIGIGAGVVLDGSLFAGSHGMSGEFGHIQVDRDGPVCGCGSRGCLECFVGLEALLRRSGVEAELATSIGDPEQGGVASLVDRARAGDERTLTVLAEAGRTLGAALGIAVNLLDPATVVLGGIFAPLSPWIARAIEEELRQGAMAGRWRGVRVAVSELGAEAAVRGAASSSLRDIVADPYLMPARPEVLPTPAR